MASELACRTSAALISAGDTGQSDSVGLRGTGFGAGPGCFRGAGRGVSWGRDRRRRGRCRQRQRVGVRCHRGTARGRAVRDRLDHQDHDRGAAGQPGRGRRPGAGRRDRPLAGRWAEREHHAGAARDAHIRATAPRAQSADRRREPVPGLHRRACRGRAAGRHPDAGRRTPVLELRVSAPRARAGAGQRSALPGPAGGTAARAAWDDPLRCRRGGRRHPADRARERRARRTLGFRAARPGRRGGDHRRPGMLPGRLPGAARRPARDRDQAVPAAARAYRRPAGVWARLDHHRRAALPQRRNRRVLGVHDDRPGRRARAGSTLSSWRPSRATTRAISGRGTPG